MKLRANHAQPFLWWVYGAIIISASFALIEVVVQQTYRQAANDPQVQIANDAMLALQSSAAILDLIPKQRVQIDLSLKEFLIIYDTEGNPIAGNGYIGEKLLVVPKGVFEAAKKAGENRVTLEPKPGIRIAAIVVPFVGREANGYALSGRNLREVEAREASLYTSVLYAWFATLLGLFVACYMGYLSRRRA